MFFQKKLFITFIIISSFTLAMSMQTIQAQDVMFDLPPSSSKNIVVLINSFYTSAVAIAGITAVVMIIIGSIYYVVSGGSQDKQREGKDIITSAVWGVVLLLGAYTILNTINPELVDLTPPGGPAPFCKQPTDPRSQCTEGQDPEVVGCCIIPSSLVNVEGGAMCPPELISSCISSIEVNVNIYKPLANCDSCNDEWDLWTLIIIKGGEGTKRYLQWSYYPKNGTTTAASMHVEGHPQGQGAACIMYAYQKKKTFSNDLKWEYADLDGLSRC